MATSVLSIGKSALAAANVGISTAGHNIANANTPGYSRQVVSQSAQSSQSFSYGFVGQGTNVASVDRVFNQMYNKQVINSQSTSSGIDAYKTQIDMVDDMLSDATAGINPSMNDFFAAVKNASANSSDIPTRQALLSSSEVLSNRFASMGNRLSEIQSDVNAQIAGHVTTVNSIATQISKLNHVIDNSLSVLGNPPNDLMDQRDNLVKDLSKVIKTTIVPQSEGSYNVFVGNGLPLVVGTEQFDLAVATNPTDGSRAEVGYSHKGVITVLGEESLVGGALGGLVNFREETLDKTQNKLGQIALVLGNSFNQQHKLGFDLAGNAGGDLFELPAPSAAAHSGNTGSAVVSSTIADPSLVTSSNYKVSYDGTNYNITRTDDNKITSFASMPQTLDGLNFNIDSGTMDVNDQFMVRPTQHAAESFKLAFSDPNLLALAGTAGSGPSDNENGLLLAKLQLKSSIQGPNDSTIKMSFTKAFATLTSEVGNKAHELEVTGQSEAQVLSSATKLMESESGVNLDEEAANLIRYQQAYQAAAKMMQMSSDLFNTLLQLGR